MKTSIATKILSIALLVVMAMTCASIINFRASRKVAEEISRLSEDYITAYGAVARLNIHSLEQAYLRRRFVINKLLNVRQKRQHPPVEFERLRELDEMFHQEMTLVRGTIARELSLQTQVVDRATLGRIDERLEWIDQQQTHHRASLDAAAASFAQGDMETFKQQFIALEDWRSTFIPYVDETRAMLLTATRETGKRAAESQAWATMLGAVILGLAAVLAICVSLMLIRQMVRPVRRLLDGTRAIAAGDYEVSVPVTTRDEIGGLTQAFNGMAEGLRTGARAREMFGKYVDARVAQNLLDNPHLLNQGGERRVMTIMFCDLKGFTALSEAMTPRGLVTVINRYFALMAGAVREHGGVIDKFIGDAMMAYWGPPFCPDGDQALASANSALEQIGRLPQLAEEILDLVHSKGILTHLEIRIGIATGEVLVGSIGSEFMRNYTVMGDAVNLASRLESANKLYGTRLLLAEETARRIGHGLELREIDALVVKGQSQPVRVFEALGRVGDVPADRMAMRECYQDGLAAYRACDWVGARKAFGEALRAFPQDGPSLALLARINAFEASPPSEGWGGAWIMQDK